MNKNDNKAARTRITNGDEIPAEWGNPKAAVRKGTIAIREPQGRETFTTPWGRLVAIPGEDVVVVQNSGEEYPVKKKIFAEIYQEISPGRYSRNTVSRVVQVPPGNIAVLGTKEGELEVNHPDYIAIGEKNEVYANSAEWLAANLRFI